MSTANSRISDSAGKLHSRRSGPVRSVNGQPVNPYIWSAIKKFAPVTVHNLRQHVTELTAVMTRTSACDYDVLAHSKCPRFEYRTAGWPSVRPYSLFLSVELYDSPTFNLVADQEHTLLIQLNIISHLRQGCANCGWQTQCGSIKRPGGPRGKISSMSVRTKS